MPVSHRLKINMLSELSMAVMTPMSPLSALLGAEAVSELLLQKELPLVLRQRDSYLETFLSAKVMWKGNDYRAAYTVCIIQPTSVKLCQSTAVWVCLCVITFIKI